MRFDKNANRMHRPVVEAIFMLACYTGILGSTLELAKVYKYERRFGLAKTTSNFFFSNKIDNIFAIFHLLMCQPTASIHLIVQLQ